VRAERAPVRASGDGFATGPLVVHVDRGSLALTVTDAAGHVIVADAGQPIRFDGPSFTISKALPLGEHIYGMGDKTGTFDRRGESFVDWNTDSYGFQRDTDPIYKSIPFYIATGAICGARMNSTLNRIRSRRLSIERSSSDSEDAAPHCLPVTASGANGPSSRNGSRSSRPITASSNAAQRSSIAVPG
jgi:hypothetical protein